VNPLPPIFKSVKSSYGTTYPYSCDEWKGLTDDDRSYHTSLVKVDPRYQDCWNALSVLHPALKRDVPPSTPLTQLMSRLFTERNREDPLQVTQELVNKTASCAWNHVLPLTCVSLRFQLHLLLKLS
jgi:hypothetical protein